MPSIIGLCHNFSHFPNSCYSIMGGTHAIEHRPQLKFRPLIVHNLIKLNAKKLIRNSAFDYKLLKNLLSSSRPNKNNHNRTDFYLFILPRIFSSVNKIRIREFNLITTKIV
jgi:hypothetical protein